MVENINTKKDMGISKRIRRLIVSAGILFMIFSFTSAIGQVKKTPAKTATGNDSLMYSIGSYLAQWVNNNGFLISNINVFLKGMDDVFRNQPRMVHDTMANTIVLNQQQAIKYDNVRKGEVTLFSLLKDRPGIGIMPNGVYYSVVTNGEGIHPLKQDTVVLHIRGVIVNGGLFEDTYTKKQPIITLVSDMIPGLASSLPMMGAGSKWQLYIPSILAYGEKGSPVIPPYSALVVDVELLEVRPVKK